jgi:hypothetical protein
LECHQPAIPSDSSSLSVTAGAAAGMASKCPLLENDINPRS